MLSRIDFHVVTQVDVKFRNLCWRNCNVCAVDAAAGCSCRVSKCHIIEPGGKGLELDASYAAICAHARIVSGLVSRGVFTNLLVKAQSRLVAYLNPLMCRPTLNFDGVSH